MMWVDDLWFFFFQAEDGIRDLVRSRGLGDVYKRQGEAHQFRALAVLQGAGDDLGGRGGAGIDQHDHRPVSYTHLTLPTSDLV